MSSSLDARRVRADLFSDGFTVFKEAVSVARCQAVVEAIAEDLGIAVGDPATWDRVSSVLDQVPLWGHQSQWDIRQDPDMHHRWATVWGTEKLWASRNSCRFTPPWTPDRVDAARLHWDADPRDRKIQWFQGILALSTCGPGEGGFCCSPSLMHNQDRWPRTWPVESWGTDYRPGPLVADEVLEVPLDVGDLLIFDHHLPHGTVRNLGDRPRVVFYVDFFPAGTPEEAQANIADHEAGVASPWWRWKPGHDRIERGPPAALTPLGRRLLGVDPW
jgi:hypothetical protein